MSSSTRTTVFITGSNRGIGLELARNYLSRPNTTVIAGVRDTNKASALHASSKHEDNTQLIVVKLDSSDNKSAAAAVAQLRNQHNVQSLDIAIANAGTAAMLSLLETDPAHLADTLQVNVVGVLAFYQAILPLLKNSTAPQGPIFTCVSSLAGSLTFIPHANKFINGGYASSKAAVNYIVTKIAYEANLPVDQKGHGISNMTAFLLHPGLVSSDMGNAASKKLDLDGMQWLTPEESAGKMIKIIDNATYENANGKFFGPDGEDLPW